MRTGIAGMLLAAALGAQEEAAPVTLRCVQTPAKNRPQIRLEGTASFKERTILTITLARLEERNVAGRLAPEALPGVTERVEVRNKKIFFEHSAEAAGVYRAEVEAEEGASTAQKWKFQFACWDDALVSRLGPALKEFDAFAEEAVRLMNRLSEASASSETWSEASKDLMKEVLGLDRKLERAEARRLYPAGVQGIREATRTVRGYAARLKSLPDGKMGIERTPSEKSREKEFTFEDFKKDVEGGVKSAGREFSLWIVKDFRRGEMRSALLDAVREQAKRPGVAPFAERLEKAAPEDLDALEKDIRGGAEEKKP